MSNINDSTKPSEVGNLTSPPEPSTEKASRAEQFCVFLFLFFCAVMAPIYREIFPFSSAPMFAAHYQERRDYKLEDRDGKKLRNDRYGLRTNWNYYLEDYYGVKYPESVVVPFSTQPDMEQVIRHVREVGIREQAAFPLKLVVRTWGASDTNHVGVVARHEYVIDTPK